MDYFQTLPQTTFQSQSPCMRIVIGLVALAVMLVPGVAVQAQSVHALDLNGDGDYIRLNHNDSVDLTEAFTFSAWVYLRSWTAPFHQFAGKGDNSWMLRRDQSGNNLRLSLRGLDAPFAGSSVAWEMPREEWVHLACTFSSADGVARLYVNGHVLLERTDLSGTLDSNTFPLAVGAHLEAEGSARRFHDGMLSDVRLYNRALSGEAITQILRRTAEVNDGLVLHWPLDEGEGQTAVDHSGTENHGEIVGGRWVSVDDAFWEEVDDTAWWTLPGQRIRYLADPMVAGVVDGPESMASEDAITVTVTANDGFRLRNIQATCGVLAQVNESEYTLSDIESHTVTVTASFASEPPREPVPIIFDTDMESDVDDVGALAMLHALADRGEVDILGIVVSAKNPASAACADRINTYFGRPDIPIGNVKGPGVDRASLYAHHIVEEFPGDLDSGDDAPDAVAVYREILAAQPDQSAVIVTIGYKTNVRDLLFSEPCEHSELSGAELIEEKVRLWVCMGGYFPEGREANIIWDYTASYEAINNWPTEIIFSGWEIGRFIYTGRYLYQLPESSPVRRSYELFNNLQPHRSWDQAALLYAARGLDGGPAADYWDYSPPGRIIIDPEDGTNAWEDDPEGTHRYHIEKYDPELIAAEIDVLMMHQPGTFEAE